MKGSSSYGLFIFYKNKTSKTYCHIPVANNNFSMCSIVGFLYERVSKILMHQDQQQRVIDIAEIVSARKALKMQKILP